MCDAVIDGRLVEFKTFRLTTDGKTTRLPTLRDFGKIEISGTLTTYFENDALLAALGRRHKAQVWRAARPHLYRGVAFGALAVVLSLLTASGAL